MNRLIALILLVLSIVFVSCENFLHSDPMDEIAAENFFNTEVDMELYANGLIQRMLPAATTIAWGDQYADNIATNTSTTFLAGAWTADQQGGWGQGTWGDLRNINYFIENVDQANVDEHIRNHYEGVGRFWRAWFYYDMVRTFGDVPWYDSPLDVDDEDQLYKPRDSREYVMEKVLEDLTYAATHCLTDNRYVSTSSRINKWVALAFKSRVALFEGTYRKYHTHLGLAESADIFLHAAADAAKELMDTGPYSLINQAGDIETQYRSMFINENVQTQEVIFANIFSEELNRLNEVSRRFNSATFGSRWSLTKQFVNTYLMLDGSRFTDKDGFEEMPFTEETENRDYRLQQTIRTPGYSRTVAGNPDTPTAPDFSITLTGYQPIKWSLDNDIYDGQAASNSIPIIRYAEVLLNYAEAKAELNQFSDEDWNITIKLLRERAGVNGEPPVNADPYLIDYYLNQTTDKWLLEVRRERGIEMVFENLRFDDIMRWRLGELIERPWYGIYIPSKNTTFDLNGDGRNDLAIVDAGESIEGVYNLVISENYRLTNGDSGYIEYFYPRQWEDFKYLRPIPTSAIVNNPNLEQNPGW